MVVGFLCNLFFCFFFCVYDGVFILWFVEINVYFGLMNYMNLEFGSGLCNFVFNELGFVCVDLSVILVCDIL